MCPKKKGSGDESSSEQTATKFSGLSDEEVEKIIAERILKSVPKNYIARVEYVTVPVDPHSNMQQSTENSEDSIELIDKKGNVLQSGKERLEKVINTLSEACQSAVSAAGDVAKGIGGPPFTLDEFTLGMKVDAKAGVIFVNFGGEANLELKFVRRR